MTLLDCYFHTKNKNQRFTQIFILLLNYSGKSNYSEEQFCFIDKTKCLWATRGAQRWNFWGVSRKGEFNKLNFLVGNIAICEKIKRNAFAPLLDIFFFFLKCGSFLCLALGSKLLGPPLFLSATLRLFATCSQRICVTFGAWHSVNRQAIIGTGLSAVCLMPCLLWKSPWNRRSKYPHWSRGRGPNDDVVEKSHGSKSNRQ